MTNSTESIIVLVPTIKQVHHREIDARRLSENDLQILRKKDPFMYHSIPEVQRAAITLQELDIANMLTQASSFVTQKSRVSTECHPSLMMEAFLENEDSESLRSVLADLLAGSVESDNEQQSEQLSLHDRLSCLAFDTKQESGAR
jgi:hypothetical protein